MDRARSLPPPPWHRGIPEPTGHNFVAHLLPGGPDVSLLSWWGSRSLLRLLGRWSSAEVEEARWSLVAAEGAVRWSSAEAQGPARVPGWAPAEAAPVQGLVREREPVAARGPVREQEPVPVREQEQERALGQARRARARRAGQGPGPLAPRCRAVHRHEARCWPRTPVPHRSRASRAASG